MDEATHSAYEISAKAFADDWETQPPPTDLHATVRRFFIPGTATADIGCGSGRDTAWLNANGYPAQGYDASESLLAEAKARHPGIPFHQAFLPELQALPTFRNILCETVIMHLPVAAIAPSVHRLTSLLTDGGILYLSWRVTQGADRRDENGRLYAAFDPAIVLDALAGTDILLDEQVGSVSSGKLIRRLVARKPESSQ
jgi:2-polyprenyl-3-methyl-5-hydroxy-6-metoxy-1,4-benzoquinol methylase